MWTICINSYMELYINVSIYRFQRGGNVFEAYGDSVDMIAGQWQNLIRINETILQHILHTLRA